MTEEEIKVLMADRCTRFEAIEHLKRGTIVYNISEEDWDKTYAGGDYELPSLREIKERGIELDFSYVELDGVEYVIEYAL